MIDFEQGSSHIVVLEKRCVLLRLWWSFHMESQINTIQISVKKQSLGSIEWETMDNDTRVHSFWFLVESDISNNILSKSLIGLVSGFRVNKSECGQQSKSIDWFTVRRTSQLRVHWNTRQLWDTKVIFWICVRIRNEDTTFCIDLSPCCRNYPWRSLWMLSSFLYFWYYKEIVQKNKVLLKSILILN